MESNMPAAAVENSEQAHLIWEKAKQGVTTVVKMRTRRFYHSSALPVTQTDDSVLKVKIDSLKAELKLTEAALVLEKIQFL